MKLLIWIMSRFNVSPELIGDITEDYVEHRSLPRLLRQTVVGITTTAIGGLWHNKRLTLCALETGWILTFFGSQLPNATMPWWTERPYQLRIAALMAASLLLGWIVARIQDQQPLGTVLLFLSPIVVMQGISDGHYLLAMLDGRLTGDVARFVAIQFWFAWVPQMIGLIPALLVGPKAVPSGSPTPD